MRRGIRRALLVLIAVLYVFSIPWYRLTGAGAGAGAEPEIWFGLPDWVAVALICYLAAAALNAVAWFFTDIPEAATAEPGAGEP